ncbi:GIY-YIG nuclease family protein [Candidatus Parcubacteria bacterium]|nr:MAG: GIY-YIG nuclease family protein [Candidatus Parcubacteria bacterium]
MREYNYYVYIMASRSKVLYIGITNNLERRTLEHKKGLIEGFSKRYRTHNLVYFEHTTDVDVAIEREKQLKRWRREKKIGLIVKENPNWEDLSSQFDL